ncbi:MAG: hypothetical protein UX91_C0007G0097 [Candidatus Amesbacteria bacterium GW2011_GWB1_47_19]|nr:MAG: hypothetical protein UW51_C0006G0082 [Candidatus Amesbacteria bacterium GW2011_GWA1_44_24]KKU31881.1 MAG: hypothetical protein UX46_C0002G0097 [Candidatus Amesbacteria bacterium GW2011_GWC1_46_24]KKU66817.1 MAG: hypothetical protein UX91_C0007G0097 [Candidatus Amesbacteria bacterium GW2011_GWB1_47_19]
MGRFGSCTDGTVRDGELDGRSLTRLKSVRDEETAGYAFRQIERLVDRGMGWRRAVQVADRLTEKQFQAKRE